MMCPLVSSKVPYSMTLLGGQSFSKGVRSYSDAHSLSFLCGLQVHKISLVR